MNTTQGGQASTSVITTPTVEDQIRDYRRMARLKHSAHRAAQQLTGSRARSFRRTAERLLNPEQELVASRNRRAMIVPAEVLYEDGWNSTRHLVYEHYDEQRILVVSDTQVSLPFIQPESFRRLRESGFQHIHLGMAMIRVQAHHSQHAGTKALVVLRDTRWSPTNPDRYDGIIGSMEIDLSEGNQLVYFIPDQWLSISDFANHIEVVVKTQGYDNWVAGESNLAISKRLLARLSNTSYVHFAYRIDGIIDFLASHGVNALEGRRFSTTDLQGRQWVLRPPQNIAPTVPRAVATQTRLDGSMCFSFSGYQPRPPTLPLAMADDDTELLLEESALMLRPQYSPDLLCQELWGPVTIEVLDPEDGDLMTDSAADPWDYLPQATSSEVTLTTGPQSIFDVPIYDDYPEDDASEQEWVNPFFSAGGGEEPFHLDPHGSNFGSNFSNLDLETSKKQETDEDEVAFAGTEDLPYPRFKTAMEEVAFAGTEDLPYPRFKTTMEAVKSSGSNSGNYYTPPGDSSMGIPLYTPGSTSHPEPLSSTLTSSDVRANLKNLRGGRPHQDYFLPSAQQTFGALLVLPDDINLWRRVIDRWESITINHLNEKRFADNKAKLLYVENLLGEKEKKYWIQWRQQFPTEYDGLVTIADDPQTITSQLRRIFTLEDPYQGSTDEQNRAYADLNRLSCTKTKDLYTYINDYVHLATLSGRSFLSPELSEKFFAKMPELIAEDIAKAFAEKYPGATIGLMPRVVFAGDYLTKICKEAARMKAIKDLAFCRQTPIMGYYDGPKKKYGLRKSKTYNGKPHKSHVRVIKNKNKARTTKCRCFICGQEGHFARECRSQKGNVARAAVYTDLALPDDFDVISIDMDDPMDDDICSIADDEELDIAELKVALSEVPFLEEASLTLGASTSGSNWRVERTLPADQRTCPHRWVDNQDMITGDILCSYCKSPTSQLQRTRCELCLLLCCPNCALFEQGRIIRQSKVEKNPPSSEILVRELLTYTDFLIKENDELREENKKLNEQLLRFLDQTRVELEERDEEGWEGPILPILQEMGSISFNEPSMAYKALINRLYNATITFIINGCQKFSVSAIFDTGATVCCIDKGSVPTAATEALGYQTNFSGVNSQTIAREKLKPGLMIIGEHSFKIPHTCVFPMNITDGCQMLIGINFMSALQGGIRFEGTRVAIYRQVTEIQTLRETYAAKVLDISETTEDEDVEGYLATRDQLCLWEQPEFINELGPELRHVFSKLKNASFIGDNPLQHWAKNQVHCKLDIINPDLTIQDRPLKHITPAMEEQFRRHISALLELKVIRPSKSRHRTMAMMVNSGTTVDPATGKEVRGKERMVFNYKSLNDNTFKDQYSLPGINTILKRIGRAKVYSKFDLKSGFHQVAMHPDSVEWTAFLVPGGLYEWLVMPFGLKNAPAVFQRKMDNCFKGTESFIAVYIDDVLVFSESYEQHPGHLLKFCDIVEKSGLVLSPTKMKLGVEEIDFLGATLGRGKIKLQPHIIKRIAQYPDEKLKDKSGLRSWLGLLNYARSYIPKLGVLLGPLYEKTSPHGDKRMKPQDWETVNKIKDIVQSLPDLELPPPDSYIILETDGCMDGWGGICKWKPRRSDPKSTERVCAYASGKFNPPKSTIDAEIHACMESMMALKIHYLDKTGITLRTDCQAIISFYDKSAAHKPSRVRWVAFTDFITGLGIQVQFEHIKGSDNTLADTLSRLTLSCVGTEAAYWHIAHQESAYMAHSDGHISWPNSDDDEGIDLLGDDFDDFAIERTPSPPPEWAAEPAAPGPRVYAPPSPITDPHDTSEWHRLALDNQGDSRQHARHLEQQTFAAAQLELNRTLRMILNRIERARRSGPSRNNHDGTQLVQYSRMLRDIIAEFAELTENISSIPL